MVPMPFKWFQSLSKASFGRPFIVGLYIFFHQSKKHTVQGYTYMEKYQENGFPNEIGGCLRWSLLDADQEIPWQDQPLEYSLKFRFWAPGTYLLSCRLLMNRIPQMGLDMRRSLALFKNSRISYVWTASQKCHNQLPSHWFDFVKVLVEHGDFIARNSSVQAVPPHSMQDVLLLFRWNPSLKLLYFEWSPPWHVGWRLSGEGCHLAPEVKQSGSEFKTVCDANLLKNYALFQHQDLRLVWDSSINSSWQSSIFTSRL